MSIQIKNKDPSIFFLLRTPLLALGILQTVPMRVLWSVALLPSTTMAANFSIIRLFVSIANYYWPAYQAAIGFLRTAHADVIKLLQFNCERSALVILALNALCEQ